MCGLGLRRQPGSPSMATERVREWSRSDHTAGATSRGMEQPVIRTRHHLVLQRRRRHRRAEVVRPHFVTDHRVRLGLDDQDVPVEPSGSGQGAVGARSGHDSTQVLSLRAARSQRRWGC